MSTVRTLAATATVLALLPATAEAKPFRWIWKHRIPAHERQWYRSTAWCESRNNPWANTGNGYYGAVQWLPSTWHAAGGNGLPLGRRHEQAVRAVRWKWVAGASQWPVCG